MLFLSFFVAVVVVGVAVAVMVVVVFVAAVSVVVMIGVLIDHVNGLKMIVTIVVDSYC